MSEWHIITCEYPPQIGGVSDYTKLVAHGLAEAGDEVQVWCPSEKQKAEGRRQKAEDRKQEADCRRQEAESRRQEAEGSEQKPAVTVHRELGTFRPRDLRRVGKHLDQFPAPRRLLVQWVPHGYGYRSMNLPFCLWLWKRAKFKGDRIELMVHEPFFAFGEGPWKQDLAAAIHRIMILLLLNAASHVWMSIPAWESYLRRYALGRRILFECIPIPSNVPVVEDTAAVQATRSRYVCNGNLLVGHFGTGERQITSLLLAASTALVRQHPDAEFLLMGRGSDQLIGELTEKSPELAGKIQATGWLPQEDLSRHISACDLMLQPYQDGISSRRTSAMVGLMHGTPVITTTGRLTEPIWAESGAVSLAAVENISSLAASTARLFSDACERKRMGAAAKELYAERFDIRHTVAALRSGRA